MKFLLSIFILLSIHTAIFSEEQKLLEKHEWPKTCDTAVDLLVSNLSEKTKKEVRQTKYDSLIMFHHGWGTSIRNNFGLWRGNKQLIKSCSNDTAHPDSVSTIIIKKTWLKLNLAFHCPKVKLTQCKWHKNHQAKLNNKKTMQHDKLRRDLRRDQIKLKSIGLYSGSINGKFSPELLESYLVVFKLINK